MRKFVRLSKEKETRSNACNEVNNEPSCSDPNIPINQVPLNSIGPTSVEGHPLNAPDEVLPGIDDPDKHFVQNIFSLMRKEETFSGQEKLMEWILQIQNLSVLCWYVYIVITCTSFVLWVVFPDPAIHTIMNFAGS